MHKKNTITGANKLFFTFTIVYLAFQVVLVIVAAVSSFIYGEDYYNKFFNDSIYGILLINQYVIILVPVIAYMLINKLNFREVFRLNRLDIIPAVIIMLLSVPAYFIAAMLNTIVVYLLQFIGRIPAQPIPVPGNLRELAVGIIVVAVSPAICEELLHRGVMLSAYENRGSMKAVVITAIFFGIFHFDITNLLGASFLGLLIGYYVIKTNSIFAGMLAHFINNAISELILYFSRNNTAVIESVTIPSEELFTSILFGIAGLILAGLLITAFNRATRGRYLLKPPVSNIRGDVVSILTHWPIISVLVIYVLMVTLFIASIISAGPI